MRRAFWLALLSTLMAVHPANAQDTSTESLNALIGELNEMIDRGERDRLADPWFLHDLRQLTARYANPFGAVTYSEEFQEDGPPPAPWQVLQGEMRTDWRSGLRSVVRSTASSTADSSDSGSGVQSGGDVGQQLLGAILRGVVRSQSGGDSTNESATAYNDGTTPAIAIAPVEFTNAFRIQAEISLSRISDDTPPSVQFGVYQSLQNIYPGYRLEIDGGAETITLLRIGSRGQSIIQTAGLTADLLDGQVHAIDWTRSPDGGFSLAIDGKDVFSTLDRGFRDPWAGLILSNSGGDFSLRRISVSGADASSTSGWSRP